YGAEAGEALAVLHRGALAEDVDHQEEHGESGEETDRCADAGHDGLVRPRAETEQIHQSEIQSYRDARGEYRHEGAVQSKEAAGDEIEERPADNGHGVAKEYVTD